jgi:hypothetical protein
LPAADAAQLRVTGKRVEQLSGESESVHGLGDESTGDGQAVLGGPTDPTSTAGYEAGQRNHLQGSHQALGWRGQFPEFLLENGEELGLQDVCELRDLLAKCKLQVGLSGLRLCVDSNSLTPLGPFSKQN